MQVTKASIEVVSDSKGCGLRTVLLGLVSCPGYFSQTGGKNSLVNSLFRFCSKRHVSGTPIRLLHENDITYCNKWRPKTAWRLKRYTRDRIRERTSEGIPGLPWMCSMCFWACKLAEWSSQASDVDKIVLGLSEVERGFKFCESSFLGIRKLREGWCLQRAVSLKLFYSFATCVT